MSNEQFQIGDTVMLNSGGPIMTVKEITDAGKEVRCIWFNNGIISSAFFPNASVKKQSPNENPTITGISVI